MSIESIDMLVTYTFTLFCSEGKAWMSLGVAAASRGASSGKRLPSFARWVWNSTDTMVDRYCLGSWTTEADSRSVSARMRSCVMYDGQRMLGRKKGEKR